MGVPRVSRKAGLFSIPVPCLCLHASRRVLLCFCSLYASPQQVERGEGLSVAGIFALPCSVLLHVSTCAPLARISKIAPAADAASRNDDDAECDSLGPVRRPGSACMQASSNCLE